MNLIISLVSIFLPIFCYTTLISLYVSGGLTIRHFIFIDEESTITPTAVVSAIGVLITGTTTAFLTWSIEHYLWIKLMRSDVCLGTARARDTHRVAQWTISPLARFTYIFNGRSWGFRLCGLLLLGTAVINPVLLYGLKPGIDPGTDEKQDIGRSEMAWQGFVGPLDKWNHLYDGRFTLLRQKDGI